MTCYQQLPDMDVNLVDLCQLNVHGSHSAT